MSTAGAGFPWRFYVVALAVIVLFAAAPLLSAFLAEALANANGCSLSEGTTNPCMIIGADWGDALYTMFVLGWFMLATLPLGGGALIVLVVVFIIHRLAWGRQQDKRVS